MLSLLFFYVLFMEPSFSLTDWIDELASIDSNCTTPLYILKKDTSLFFFALDIGSDAEFIISLKTGEEYHDFPPFAITEKRFVKGEFKDVEAKIGDEVVVTTNVHSEFNITSQVYSYNESEIFSYYKRWSNVKSQSPLTLYFPVFDDSELISWSFDANTNVDLSLRNYKSEASAETITIFSDSGHNVSAGEYLISNDSRVDFAEASIDRLGENEFFELIFSAEVNISNPDHHKKKSKKDKIDWPVWVWILIGLCGLCFAPIVPIIVCFPCAVVCCLFFGMCAFLMFFCQCFMSGNSRQKYYYESF